MATPKGVPIPDLTDPPNGPAQIGDVATWVDEHPGISVGTYAQINAFTGADLWEGRKVYQTDTGTNRPVVGEYTYNGVAWRPPWNMPWGIVGTAFNTAAQTSIGTGPTDVTGVTVTATVAANRYIEASLWGRLEATGNGTSTLYVHDGTTSLIVASRVQTAGDIASFTGARLLTPSAGSLTIKAQAGATGGSGGADVTWSATNPWRLTIRDLGPNGAPA